MNDDLLEEVLDKGQDILTISLDGDSPMASGSIVIYRFKEFYYIIADFDEYFGPVASLEDAMQWNVFDCIGTDYEVTSDNLPIERLEAIKEDIKARIVINQMD